MERHIKQYIINDLPRKIVLISGPRQSGKTILAKDLTSSYDYLNIDVTEDIFIIRDKSWDRNKELLILDELHKLPNWKRLLKGIYDSEGLKPNIVVTGSAKLDTYKKVGDSLAGRYFQYRLFPLDIQEAKHYWQDNLPEIFRRLMECSGFPEPFLSGSQRYYRRWRRTHVDIMLRQDILDENLVTDIKSVEVLIALLQQRVTSGISYANISRDIQKDPSTVKRWCELLENIYVIFKVSPYHKNIARSLLKEPKYYFYDFAALPTEGAKLENLVAFSILKHLKFLEDTEGFKVNLHYCRTKDGKEIDFLVIIEDRCYLIEVKSSDSSLSPSFSHFRQYFPNASCIQLVANLKRSHTYPDGSLVTPMVNWLAEISKNLV